MKVMNRHILTAKGYIIKHKNEFSLGAAGLGLVAIIAIGVIAFINFGKPNIVYQPVVACELFNTAEARELLGKNTLNSSSDEPVLMSDLGTSRCGYTDGNPDTDNMVVAAIVVRSGINDTGVEKNKREFTQGKPARAKQINDVGDAAYFNETNGQLNILHGRDWIILSYGVGSEPRANTEQDALKLAAKVIDTPPVTGTF